MKYLGKTILILSFFIISFLEAGVGLAYGVLSHQAIIDLSWTNAIVPALLAKHPNATEVELQDAYAFAYGGAIIQDMGYFPFGNTFFTDLTHYVRSGDFIEALLRESTSLHEYSFALGALAHYYADNYGHPLGTNLAVPLVYPKLIAAHGDTITYEEHPAAHVQMEFGFDVLQVARGNYAPEAYHDFIGFKVSEELLERAFFKTYGFKLEDLFLNLGLTINTFRYSVRNLIPDLTKAAWNLKADEITAAEPSMTKRRFQYRLSNAQFHEEWGREYNRPSLFQRILSWLLKILPKIGPSEVLAFKPPTPEAEKVFMESFNATAKQYGQALERIRNGDPAFVNTTLDTGEPIQPNDYEKADEAYTELLARLAKDDFKNMPEGLRNMLVQYFSAMPKTKTSDKEALEEWAEVQKNFAELKALK